MYGKTILWFPRVINLPKLDKSTANQPSTNISSKEKQKREYSTSVRHGVCIKVNFLKRAGFLRSPASLLDIEGVCAKKVRSIFNVTDFWFNLLGKVMFEFRADAVLSCRQIALCFKLCIVLVDYFVFIFLKYRSWSYRRNKGGTDKIISDSTHLHTNTFFCYFLNVDYFVFILVKCWLWSYGHNR